MNNFEIGKKKFESGLSSLLEEKYDKAEIEFLESLKFVPDRISTIKNLILIYVKTKDKKGLSKFIKSQQHLANKSEIIFAKAYEKYFERKYNDAIKLCNLIINRLDKELEFEALGLLAVCYRETNLFLEALKVYKESLLKYKNNFITFQKLGFFFYETGKLNKAKIYYEKSQKLKPLDNENLWNLSLCLLKLKEFDNGFELFESRWHKKTKKFKQVPEIINLESISQKKLLIWNDQGLGDAMIFSRFILNLLKFTKNITLAVHSNLEIFKFLYPEISIIESKNAESEKFDYQISISSLPRLLKIRKLDEFKLKKINLNKKIPEIGNFKIQKEKLNIGLSWFVDKNTSKSEYRSMKLKYFDEFAQNNKLKFYKLSRGLPENDTYEYENFEMVDLGEKNFMELAKIINKLDLIFTIDTSIIHLCGILNLKSYLLLNFNSDWRWFEDTKDTIWYPSVTIIKQKKYNNWKNVIDEVKKIINLNLEQKFND